MYFILVIRVSKKKYLGLSNFVKEDLFCPSSIYLITEMV